MMETKTLITPPQLKRGPLPIPDLSLDIAVEHELRHGCFSDEGKLRRTISNRLSAQRSRLRKHQYIIDLEKMVHDLEKLISILTNRVKRYEEKKALLLDQNASLRNLLESHSNESKRSEIEFERKQAQLFRLREVEKFMNRKRRDSNLNEQQLHRGSRQPPYPLGFGYGFQPLQRFEANDQFCQWRFITGSARQPVIEPSSRCKDQEMSVASKNEDVEAEIDQYFNFEDLNFCEAAAASDH